MRQFRVGFFSSPSVPCRPPANAPWRRVFCQPVVGYVPLVSNLIFDLDLVLMLQVYFPLSSACPVLSPVFPSNSLHRFVLPLVPWICFLRRQHFVEADVPPLCHLCYVILLFDTYLLFGDSLLFFSTLLLTDLYNNLGCSLHLSVVSFP